MQYTRTVSRWCLSIDTRACLKAKMISDQVTHKALGHATLQFWFSSGRLFAANKQS